MCIRNKWTKFIPTTEYLAIVKPLTSVTKLNNFLKQFKWQGEKGDHWKTPWEFIQNKDKDNDCEDFVRFIIDVLVRVIGIKGARFVIQSGYDKERWGNRIWNVKCHAICVFPYLGKLAVFDNGVLKVGYKSMVETGYITFPDGLKYQEVRDWQGKVLSRKFKIFGTF